MNAQQEPIIERVAVVVVVDAEGRDTGDRHNNAVNAVAEALDAAGEILSVRLPSGTVRSVRRVEVKTLSSALRDGSLLIAPAADPA